VEILTKGSLCTGTGSLDASLPGKLSWLAETDDSCTRLLKREHPDVLNHGDITASDFAGEHVDLLTSGDPCQSLSAAGRQMASDDARFLWPHVIQVIDRVKPKHVFLENVQNVTSVALVKGADDWRGQKGSVLAMRLADLRTAGYACRWTVLGACTVGACHHRHRWFLRGEYVGRGAPEAERLIMKCGAPRTGGRVLLPTPVKRDHKGVDMPHRDGGMSLPSVITLLPTPNARDGGDRGTPTPDHALRRAANPERSLNLEDAAMAYLLPTLGQAVRENWGKYADGVQLWAETFGVLPPDPTEPAPRGGRRLNAALSEWMMGHRPGFLTDEFARSDALRMAGNGVVAVQARAAWDLLGEVNV
jgi:DNA (cytosine-5)-methyltransferase 1